MATRSRTTTDDSGWTWLEPERRSLTLRHALVSFVLSLLLVAGAAAATLPPRLLAVPLLAMVMGVGIVIARGTWLESHTRLGVSDIGLLVQRGTDQQQIGWDAVGAVTAYARRGRRRITVTTRSDAIAVQATFSDEPTRRWLAACEAQASARRLDPQPSPRGLGFIAGDLVA